MSNRTDPSSLSFGARLRTVENELAVSKRRVRELETTSLDKDQKQDANERRRLKRAENARASALLASGQATLEELNTIDQTLLPLAQRDLIQQEIVAKGYAAAMPSKVQLDDAAWQRIRNWQSTFEPSEVFESNNAKPEPQASKQFAWGREFYKRQRDQLAQQARLSYAPDPMAGFKQQKAKQVEQERKERDGKFLNRPRLGS